MGLLANTINKYLLLKAKVPANSKEVEAFQKAYDDVFKELGTFANASPVTIQDVVRYETPIGLVNGSNATYTTFYNFVPETVQVWINGLLQKKPQHFNTSGTNTIHFMDSPVIGDSISVNYTKA